MKSLAALGFLLTVPVAIAVAESSAASPNEGTSLEEEKAAIVEVIERQAAAFWAKDFQRWADTWVHAPHIRRLGWSEPGGVSSVEGWEAIGARMKKSMADNPTPNLTPAKLVRERLNFRIQGDVAWVTFEQHGISTGEPRFDMPGLSHETRILEKHNGKWKVAYLGYLLAGTPETRRPAAGGQASTLIPSEVTAFMGTWPLIMTNPEGARETVRILDDSGVVRASVQAGGFPPISATGIMKDGDMLVLTLARFENGKPHRAVIALTLDRDTMNMAQLLEFSQTIKRGSGKKAE